MRRVGYPVNASQHSKPAAAASHRNTWRRGMGRQSRLSSALSGLRYAKIMQTYSAIVRPVALLHEAKADAAKLRQR
jgi:hypothetical protein